MDHLPICCSNVVGICFIEIGIAIGIGIEMVLGHEKLDGYRLSIGNVAWFKAESRQRKGELASIGKMLSRLSVRGYSI